MKMKFVLVVIAVLLVVVIGVIFVVANMNARQVANIMKARETAAPITYKRLSTEKEFPFLLSSKRLRGHKKNFSSSRYKSYQQAIASWPDVRSCLIAAERKKEQPNILLFDWQQVHSTEEAEVCLFRVMSSLDDIDKAMKWFQAQGFDSVKKLNSSSSGIGPDPWGQEYFSATWFMKSKGSPVGSNSVLHVIESIFPLAPYQLTVGVGFTSEEVVNVGVGYSRL